MSAAQTKLIPEAIESALTSLATVAATTCIVTGLGNRALDSALAVLATALFAHLIRKLQQFPSFSQLIVWLQTSVSFTISPYAIRRSKAWLLRQFAWCTLQMLSKVTKCTAEAALAPSCQKTPAEPVDKSWFRSFRSSFSSCFVRFRSALEQAALYESQSFAEDPTQFNRALAPPAEALKLRVFKYNVKLTHKSGMDTVMIVWMYKTFGVFPLLQVPEHLCENDPSKLNDLENIRTLQRVGNGSNPNELAVGDMPNSNPKKMEPVVVRTPVWFDRKLKDYVVFQFRSNELFADSQSMLADIIRTLTAFSHTAYFLSLTTSMKTTIDIVNASNDRQMALLPNSRSFHHLFFENKDILISTLERFRSGTMHAPHLGEENALTLLLYGPPGTGKTSIIRALPFFIGANKCVVITAADMQNKSILEAAFASPAGKVFVFDEFDIGIAHLLPTSASTSASASSAAKESDLSLREMNREAANRILKSALAEENLVAKEKLMEDYRKILEKLQHTSLPDKQWWLTFLDGIRSKQDRCIIMATNRDPKEFPVELMRSGRIDCTFYCKPARGRVIMDMVSFAFQCDITERRALDSEFAAAAETAVVSQADIRQACSLHKSGRDVLLYLISTALNPTASAVQEKVDKDESKEIL